MEDGRRFFSNILNNLLDRDRKILHALRGERILGGDGTSGHSKPASKCSRQLCYGGNSKASVFVSIRNAFLSLKPEFVTNLEESGIPVEDVVIAGSVVEGDFGCRNLNKVEKEILKLEPPVWDKDTYSRVKSILDNSKSTLDFYRTVEANIDDEIIVEDVFIACCSDIDVCVVTPRPDKFFSVRQSRSEKVVENFESKMNKATTGNMFTLVNPAEEVIGKVLSSKSDFNSIISKYYSNVLM